MVDITNQHRRAHFVFEQLHAMTGTAAVNCLCCFKVLIHILCFLCQFWQALHSFPPDKLTVQCNLDVARACSIKQTSKLPHCTSSQMRLRMGLSPTIYHQYLQISRLARCRVALPDQTTTITMSGKCRRVSNSVPIL